MRCLITADFHLNDDPKDAYRFTFLEKTLPKLIEQHQPDRLLVLGDLTAQKDRHSAWLTNTIADLMWELSQDVLVTILRGNHDYLDIDNPFFAFLARIPRIVWIQQPTYVDEGYLFLPHTSDYKRDWKGISMKVRWIFCHNTFAGAQAANGHPMDGIPLTVFPKGARVISGDVHLPQVLGPVTYVGAPYLVDFGDRYQPRVLLLDDNGVESLRVPGPQKRLIRVTWPERPIKESWTEYFNFKINPGDILKVEVEITAKQQPKWSEIVAEIRNWGDREGYQIHLVKPIVSHRNRLKSKVRVKRRSDEEILEAYSNARKLDPRTMKVGFDLL